MALNFAIFASTLRFEGRRIFARAAILALAGSAFAADFSAASADAECAGTLYAAKHDNVPVYDEASERGQVVAKLVSGQRVCRVGLENHFIIITGDVAWCVNAGNASSGGRAELYFVRETDVLETDSGDRGAIQRKRDPISSIKRYYRYMQSGGVPEDGLLPFRSILDLFKNQNSPVDSSSGAK